MNKRSFTSMIPCHGARTHGRVLWMHLGIVTVVVTVSLVPQVLGADETHSERLPNFVIVLADDQGYADVGCFGSPDIQTPHLDQMAREGVRLTDFHVAAAVCSASRAALLTGCYPQRVSILGALGPGANHGIHQAEILISEILKERGYATAIFGKWHLGDAREFLPLRHGFDEYFGLPYSNDMWPRHPTTRTYPDLPLIEGDRVVEHNPDQSQLTVWYTQRAVQFIEQHRERPFFLYVAHNMPHVPLYVSEKFRGQSARGLYGDVIMEIDWSVGQILATLDRLELAETTLVLFTSDNGPWLSYGNHAGSAGTLREGKGTTWEGGMRVPCIARWPGRIPLNNVCHELASTMDVLPTVARLAGAPLPSDRVLDGHDIWPLLSGQPGAKSPYDVFYYYTDRSLEAVRQGKWKLHLAHRYRTLAGEPGNDGRPGPYTTAHIDLALYDLDADVGETHDVADQHPQIVQRLLQLAERAREDLGDALTNRTGSGVRPAGEG